MVSSVSAEFDLMPDGVSSLLRPLIDSLCPQLVRSPEKLRRLLSTIKVNNATIIDSTYLSVFFNKDEGVSSLLLFLKTFEDAKMRSDALEVFLLETVLKLVEDDEKRLHILDGCRLLPRSDDTMFMMKVMNIDKSTHSIDWILSPSSEERRIFRFAKSSLVPRLTTKAGSRVKNKQHELSIPTT